MQHKIAGRTIILAYIKSFVQLCIYKSSYTNHIFVLSLDGDAICITLNPIHLCMTFDFIVPKIIIGIYIAENKEKTHSLTSFLAIANTENIKLCLSVLWKSENNCIHVYILHQRALRWHWWQTKERNGIKTERKIMSNAKAAANEFWNFTLKSSASECASVKWWFVSHLFTALSCVRYACDVFEPVKVECFSVVWCMCCVHSARPDRN